MFQRAMALVRPIHVLAASLPPHEASDLAQQMRRASKSVPANISEGFSRRLTARDFKLYLAHALGSANEMTVHVRIAKELEYGDPATLEALVADYRILARQLARLIQVWRDPPERNVSKLTRLPSDPDHHHHFVRRPDATDCHDRPRALPHF